MILDATTKSIEIDLDGAVAANQLPVFVSYADHTASAFTPGASDTQTNNTTAVTIVAAPASATQRQVKNITVYNADTAAAVVTIQLNNDGTLRTLVKVTLDPGDTLIYDYGLGWKVLDSTGAMKALAGEHASTHISGGSDAFTSSHFLEAVVKRLRTTTGPADLTVGAIADGEYLKRSGASVLGDTPATSGSDKLLHVRDEKASGTAGGTFTSGAWQTRDLNTVLTNEISGASLSSNQITLPAGTYHIEARAPAYIVDTHKAKLRNVTDGSDEIIGSSTSDTNSASHGNDSIVTGRFTIAAEKTFELQHRCTTPRNTDGFGCASSFGVVEVFAEVRIWKIT